MEGLRYVMGHPVLRPTVLITVLMNIVLFPYMHMVPVVARDVLHVGPLLMGTLSGAPGVGSLVGAIGIASATNIRRHSILYLGGSAVTFVALMLFAVSKWYSASLLALLLLGLGASGFATMQTTIIILVSREDMRGKALGVVSLAIGASPFGSLLVGFVAAQAGVSFALGLNAGIGLSGMALFILLAPALRRPITAHQRE